MEIFNFFQELKTKCCWPKNGAQEYSIINISGKIVYVEGQKGLLVLSSDMVVLKLSGSKKLEIKGANLLVRELTSSTIILEGKIYKTEVF